MKKFFLFTSLLFSLITVSPALPATDLSINKIIEKKESKEKTVFNINKRINELKTKDKVKLQRELSEVNKNGQSPVYYAVELMNESLFNNMINGLGTSKNIASVINKKDKEGQTLLLHALKQENPKTSIIKKLIDGGADCNYSQNTYNDSNLSVLILAEKTGNKDIINLVLPEVEDLNLVWEQKSPKIQITPLALLVYQAGASSEYNSILKTFLEKGALPDTEVLYEGYSGAAIHFAAKNNNKNIYNILKANGADFKKADSNGDTPLKLLVTYCQNDVDRLFFAYEEGGTTDFIIQNIINNNLINQTSSGDDKTPIQIAMMNNDSEAAIKLLNAGADVYPKNTDNKTVIDYAVLNGSDVFIDRFIELNKSAKESLFSIIDFALDREKIDYVKKLYNIDSTKYSFEEESTKSTHNYFTYTAFTKHGNSEAKIELADFFLKKGFSVNDAVSTGDDAGNTALIYAAKNSESDFADFLIKKGADPFAANSGKYAGRTAAIYALEAKNEHICDVILTDERAQRLFTRSLNNKNDKNATFLMFVSRYGTREQIAKYLPVIFEMDKNALDKKDSEGLTPFLYAAAYNEDLDVMKILRMYGADVYGKAGQLNAAELAEKFNPKSADAVERLKAYGVLIPEKKDE